MKNKRRVFFILALAVLAALCAVIFCACGVDDVEEIVVTPGEISVRVGEFAYEDYSVTMKYHSGKEEEIVLAEDMIAPSDRLKFFIEGDYEIPVTYQNKTAIMKVNVRRNVFAGATFEDLDVVYNGEFYTVEVQNVPEGTTVTYPTTNRFRSAGEYEATAILRKDAYEMKEMKAKVTIRKADYDLSDVVFENKTEVFDGESHVLSLEGTMPAGLYVDYTITREGGKETYGNAARNAGVYTVRATFTGDATNFNVIEPREAVLTITQATIDISGVSFDSKTETFDRTRHELSVQGTLPQGVSVTYENNGQVNAGTYEVRAVFTVEDSVNYAPIASKTATLTIEKAEYDMSSVHFNGTRTAYDGTEKTIELQGDLPIGVHVTYTNNVGVDAGTYRATATFTSADRNYNAPSPLAAELIIDPVAAPMGQIVFERKRFITRGRGFLDYFNQDPDGWYDEEETDDEDEELSEWDWFVKYYDPYLVAMEYRPANLPQGMTIKEIKYCKTDGWVDDLTVYDGTVKTVDGIQHVYTDKISEDGYYVVFVTFDGHGNYTDVLSVRTQIRADAVDLFPTTAASVYDGDWVDPSTGRTVGVYLDTNYQYCRSDERISHVGAFDYEYCDCNVFLDYQEGGAQSIVCPYDTSMPDETREAFAALARNFKQFMLYKDYANNPLFGATYFNATRNALVTAAAAATKGPTWYQEPDQFDVGKIAVIGLDYGYAYSTAASQTLDQYRALIANLMGYTDAADFLRDAAGVRDVMMANGANASMASVADQCRYRGAVYERYDEDTVYEIIVNELFILPFKFGWYDEENEESRDFYVFVVFDKNEGDNRATVFVSDIAAAIACSGKTSDRYVNVYGRCVLTESPGYRWRPSTHTVRVDGVETERYVTSGNDLSVFAGSDATQNLEEDRTVYRFVYELPGNCTEEMEGYDPEDYTVSTDRSVVTFCEDDLLGKILRDGGDVSGLGKREAREDHAQFEDETIAAFDDLSRYFAAFFEQRTDDDYWRLDVTNRYYGAYSDFFRYAQSVYASANRALGRHSEYTIADSVIVGLNRSFAIWIGGSKVNYSVDEYRTIVMRLFGFEDLDTFTSYADALAKALRANAKHASAEYASTRLLYDGAFYAENGYFILPYAFESDLTGQRVLSFIFVDKDGNMAMWLSNAQTANAAVAFPSDGDKTNIEVIGRCLLFEDDPFVLMEELDPDVLSLIDDLKYYSPFDLESTGEKETPIAIERLRNVVGVGDFLVYTQLYDEEGFEVEMASVYDFQREPETVKGFYTYISVASLDAVKAFNLQEKEKAETPYEEEENQP